MVEVVLMCQIILAPADNTVELHCPGIPETTKVIRVYSEPIGDMIKFPVDENGNQRVLITPANKEGLTSYED